MNADLEFHPVADIFPMMSALEFDGLVADVDEHGLREPIWLHIDGRIIDGRNRYRACQKLDLDANLHTRTYDGPDEGLVPFVVSMNLHRRHLNESQRSMVAARIATMQQGARTDLASIDAMSQSDAAELLSTSRPGVQRARKVLDSGVPELIEAVDSGEMAVSAAAVIAEQPAKVQREALTEYGRDATARQMREAVEARQAVARTRKPEPVLTPDLPHASRRDSLAVQDYQCVVIDPPWPVQKIEREARPDQGVALDYPTLEVWCQQPDHSVDDEYISGISCWEKSGERELCKSIECVCGRIMNVNTAENCHIYLWVTHKFLPDGLRLLNKWGFNYQCVMTWRKNVGITPFSWMYDTEHVLFGRKGNLPLSQLGLRLSFEAPVAGHSVKPDVFYERVSAASPGPRLDLFPGVRHDGFNPWGLEASHRTDV